jgi:hypothetical protein
MCRTSAREDRSPLAVVTRRRKGGQCLQAILLPLVVRLFQEAEEENITFQYLRLLHFKFAPRARISLDVGQAAVVSRPSRSPRPRAVGKRHVNSFSCSSYRYLLVSLVSVLAPVARAWLQRNPQQQMQRKLARQKNWSCLRARLSVHLVYAKKSATLART